MKVNRNGRSETVEVTADGEGFCSQAGALLLSNLCDRLGLTEALSEALAPTRQRRSAHADGEILRDLIVMLVQGGEHLCDLATLRDQPGLFGDVASDATAFRAIERIGAAELEGIRAARKAAREQAFALGAGPAQSILDIDASLLGADSEKEGAAGNYKGGFGFHPMLCYLEGSEGALDGILRPGNAGANTGADQVAAVEAALEQLPPDAMEEEILLRGDSAACVHALVDFCREGDIRFSVGHDLTACVREAIAGVPDDAWVGAISQDGEPVAEHPSRPREAYVCELTEHLDLSAWPAGSRLICRRERAHPGAQLSLIDTDGWRHQCFLTDQAGEDLAELDRLHRAHAHVEQRIEDAKALGLAMLPFRSFQMNEAWMQLVLAAQDIVGYAKALTLTGELAKAKPQTLRYRLLHQAGRLAHSGRRTHLRLARHWPWAEDLAAACARLDALPLPAG